MRFLTNVAALCAGLLAACGGSTTSDGDGGGGVGAGATWHRTIVGDSFTVLDVQNALGEATVTLDVSDAGTYASYASLEYYDPFTRRWDGASWVTIGGTPATSQSHAALAATHTASGDPVLIWSQGAQIHAARNASGTWIAMGDPITSSSGQLRAASSPAGPVIAWTVANETTTVVQAARWDNGAWVELGAPRPALWGATYLTLATTPDGAPVLAYAAPDGAAVVEQWNAASLAWTATPTLGITGAPDVEVSVDATGAIYVAASSVAADGYTVNVDGVWRLAPGTQTWTSLGLPPEFTTAWSRMTLLGLPGTGGGVAAAWIKSGAHIARYTGSAWETVYSPPSTPYRLFRPMLAATSPDDLWFAYVAHIYMPSMNVWRLQKY